MKKLSLAIAIPVLLTLGSGTFAQDVQSPAVNRPCINEDGPGRPTLKRRAPTPDQQPDRADAETSVLNVAPCDPAKNQKTVAIKFEGLSVIPESDIRHLLSEKGISLTKDSNVQIDLVKKAEEAIKEFLMARGYRRASVASRLDQSDAGGASLTFVVNEGVRLHIAEIRFEGNRIFASLLLASEMKEILMHYQEEEPDRFDSLVIEYALHRLMNFERSQGYLQARFDEPRVEEADGGLIVTIRTDEGVLYRLGKVEIDGASLMPRERVRAMLKMRSGDVVNGEKLSKWLYEELKEFYGEKGFIQYSAEVDPEFYLKPGAREGVVDLKITIDEGRRFKLRKIRFAGAGSQEQELLQLLSLRDGDTYNQKLFENSIKKLNDTGLFEFVDKDKDADFRTNEEEGLIDVVIKVTKREG